MKYLRTYNDLKLETAPSWEITSKKQSLEIVDEDNGFTFFIKLGKKPKVQVFKDSNRDFLGEQVGKIKIK